MAEIANRDTAEYVRKDVFEISIQRLEALMEKGIARQEAIAAEIKGDIRVLDTRLSGLETTVYWGFALMGLFVALLGFFITFAPSIWGLLRKRGRPSVSRKEVENIVHASFDRYLEQSKAHGKAKLKYEKGY